MKQTLQEKLLKRQVKLPNGLLYWILMQVVKVLNRRINTSFRFKADPRKDKDPFILISNHASRVDYQFTGPACYPNKLNYVVGYKKDKDDVIEGYVTLLSKYLDEGMWEDAKSLVEFYGQGNYTQPLNHGLYNYLLSIGEYDQAEGYINVESKPTDTEYYGYMEECVKLMCAAGLISPAHEFIAKKTLHFAANRSGYYSKARVEERLNKIVAAYK